MQQAVILLGSFLVLGSIFALLERRFPSHQHHLLFHPSRLVDLGWWLMNGFANQMGAWLALGLLALLAIAPETLLEGRGPIGEQPFWLQTVEMLLLADFAGYWLHRLKHRWRFLWRFHAIHHSPVTLDWLASARIHPVDSILTDMLRVGVLVALGFAPVGLAALAPASMLASIGVHANLRWDFGPLRYVIVSPVFHRWHHTSETEGQDRNFAPMFPIWDIMFGTFFLPPRQARIFGVTENVPRGLWGQLAWPFRRPPTAR